MWRVHDRIIFISNLLKNKGFSSILIGLRVGPDEYTGWFKMKGHMQNATVFIAEYISGGIVRKYSYVLLLDTKLILRYDNAPHFPSLHTFPNHKHYEDKVYPLEKPRIETFLEECTKILKTPKDEVH